MLIELKKNKNKIIAASTLTIVFIVAAILVQTLTPGIIWVLTPKAKAAQGLLPTVSQNEHIDNVPDGEIRYLINNNVVFEKRYKKGNFMFENPAACKYSLKFFVYEIIGDGKTENLIYESPLIQPGEYLLNDKLKKKLDSGVYDCVYYARAYIGGKLEGERNGALTVTILD